MGARRFGPDFGSFLQQDQFSGALADLGLALDPLTQNRYALAGGNPISYVEWDGHVAQTLQQLENINAEPAVTDPSPAPTPTPAPAPGPATPRLINANTQPKADNSNSVSASSGSICERLGACKLSPHPASQNPDSFMQHPAHAPCGSRDWAEGFHNSPLTLDFGSTCLIQMTVSLAPGMNLTVPGALNLSASDSGGGSGDASTGRVRKAGSGHTPVIRHRFKWKRASMAAAICYGSLGGGAAVAFHHQQGAYDTDTLIQALAQLRVFLGGQKATLVWDGLPAHRSRAMRHWLARQRSWLVVEPLPGYAPELNPVEGLWSNLKGTELANLAADTIAEVVAAAERGIQRIRSTHWLAYSFLRHCGLSLW
jgi:transposase